MSAQLMSHAACLAALAPRHFSRLFPGSTGWPRGGGKSGSLRPDCTAALGRLLHPGRGLPVNSCNTADEARVFCVRQTGRSFVVWEEDYRSAGLTPCKLVNNWLRDTRGQPSSMSVSDSHIRLRACVRACVRVHATLSRYGGTRGFESYVQHWFLHSLPLAVRACMCIVTIVTQ